MQETSGVAATDLNRSARLPSALDLVTDRIPTTFHRSSFPFRMQPRAVRYVGEVVCARCLSRLCDKHSVPVIPRGPWFGAEPRWTRYDF